MAYYAIGHVVVVEADDAETARELALPRDENPLSDDGAYLGVAYSGEACPITHAMSINPDWHVLLFYGATEAEVHEGRVLPLMEGDDA